MFREMSTEHVHFRNIILPVFVYTAPPPQVKFISLHMHMALGCKFCVDALTGPNSLSVASEDPRGTSINPQIPFFPLIFSTVCANGEIGIHFLSKVKCNGCFNE